MLLAIALVAVMLTFSADDATDLAFSDRIQVVDVDGELVVSRPILDQLKRYEDSNSVKAILLNIDSPGGGVAVSQEIYTEIRRLRDKKDKIVVAYLSSTGASGAYYVACAANMICTYNFSKLSLPAGSWIYRKCVLLRMAVCSPEGMRRGGN